MSQKNKHWSFDLYFGFVLTYYKTKRLESRKAEKNILWFDEHTFIMFCIIWTDTLALDLCANHDLKFRNSTPGRRTKVSWS